MRIEDIARLAHEINRAYCASIGDHSQPEWDAAPEWVRASCVAGVEHHLIHFPTPEQAHNRWMEYRIEAGWTYGPVKDDELKQHPCMVPYSHLPHEQRVKDHLFGAVVRTCARMAG